MAIGTTMPVAVEGALKITHDAIAFGGSRVDRHQIVVVQVDAPGAELRRGDARCESGRAAGERTRRMDRGRGCPRSTGQR